MSDFQWKPNAGGLFLNRGKGPKFRGEINIDGKVIKLAAWEKETKNGDPWYSLNVDTFMPKPKAEAPKKQEFDDDISDLPF